MNIKEFEDFFRAAVSESSEIREIIENIVYAALQKQRNGNPCTNFPASDFVQMQNSGGQNADYTYTAQNQTSGESRLDSHSIIHDKTDDKTNGFLSPVKRFETDRLRRQLDTLQKELNQEKDENDRLSAQLNHNKDENTALTKQLQLAKDEAGRLAGQLQQSRDENSRLTRQLQDYSPVRRQVNMLQSELSSKESELAGVKNSLTQKNNELEQSLLRIDSLQQSLKKEQEEKEYLASELSGANSRLTKLQNDFGTPLYYFEGYKKLSYEVRSSLENAVNCENFVLFAASCAREETLDSMWLCAQDISWQGGGDFSFLKALFDYFFDIYNSSLSEPKYIRDDTAEGDEFDSDLHSRFRGSMTSGDVGNVILRGYVRAGSGRVVHKSIVSVV